MSKKVVVISTSLRAGSFSETLAKEFCEGAKESGNDVAFISLKGKKMGFCIGCERCLKSKKCVIPDDSQEIIEVIRTSDVVAWFTPIYYYGMSGQMKTLMDRGNCIWSSERAFKDVYLVCTCADESPDAIEGTLKGVEGWVRCFEGVRMAGSFVATGLPKSESLEGKGYLEKVRAMGKAIGNID